MTNFDFYDDTQVTTTFVPAEHGSYTVDGVEVTEMITKTQSARTPYSVVATPEEGYAFAAWHDEISGEDLSTKASDSLTISADARITALFSSQDAPFAVGSMFYDSYDEALAAAQAQGEDTIVLVKNYTLNESIEIPAGITLLIPYDDAHTCFKGEIQAVEKIGDPPDPRINQTYQTPYPYVTLTVADGATITVNGAMSVSAQHTAASGALNPTYGPTGPCGYVYLDNGSSIQVNNNGGLYAFGYVYGPGQVSVKSGGEVYELMQVAEFRGGSATMNLASGGKVFPFSQYFVQNVESALTLEPGAEEYVVASLYALGMAVSAKVQFVGPEGMFRIYDGSLTKRYLPATDNLQMDVDGDGAIVNLALKMQLPMVGNMDIDSATFTLPITNNILININSGETTIGQDVAFLPGNEVTVRQGASVLIEEGKKVIVYDLDEWMSDRYVYSGSNEPHFKVIRYSPTVNGTPNVRKDSSLSDALLDINGTVKVAGALYTTQGGAEIISSEGTGLVKMEAEPGTETKTYQAKSTDTVVEIPMTAAKLKNGSSADEPFTLTAEAAAGDEIPWSVEQDKWLLPEKTYTITFDPNGGEGEMEPMVCTVGDKVYLPDCEFTRTGYVFVGWGFDREEVFYYADEEFIGNNEFEFVDTTLYAIWEEDNTVYYTVTFQNEDGTMLQSGQVAEGTVPAYDGPTPTKEADTLYTYVFVGWKAEGSNKILQTLPAVTADVTYTAAFRGNLREYNVTFDPQGGFFEGEYSNHNDEPYSFDSPAGDELPIIYTVKRNGYSFKEWNTKPDGSGDGKQVGDTYQVLGDITFYAIWEPEHYTISFAPGFTAEGTEGEVLTMDPIDGDFGVAYTLPACAFVHPGFTFTGWKDRVNNMSYTDGASGTFKENITLTAQWKVAECKVIFDVNGGSDVDLAEFDLDYGSVITLPETTREGYTMQWEVVSGKDVGTLYDAGDEYPVTQDTTFKAKWTPIEYTITWLIEGYDVQTSTVPYGETPVYPYGTPLKSGNAQYTYTFQEWTPAIVPVTGDATYTAVFKATVNKYTITFENEDGTVLQSSEVEYGQTPAYNGETPTKAADAQYTYTFTGWDPKIEEVTCAVTYKATYTETVNKYTIKFVNWNGDELQSGEVEYGQTPAYNGETPTKAADAQYTYNFAGWTPEIASVTGDAIYTATYTKTVNKYTIKFVNWNGDELQSGEVEYGETPVYNGETPTKAATTQYTYEFSGWTPEIVAVTEDATYTAQFDQTVNKYLITWTMDDGSVIDTTEVEFGTVPMHDDPSKADDDLYTYSFASWSPNPVAVNGPATYKATFTATAIPHTVTFNKGAEDAEGTMEPLTINGVEETELTANAFTRTGYTFTGWVDQDGNTYADKAKVKATKDLTLTAQWEINTYTITWQNDDGTVIDTTTVEHGVIPTHAEASKTATAEFTYTFAGWNPTPVAATEDATYTATFNQTKNSYTITWKNDDGSVIDTTTVEYGAMPTHADATKANTAEWTYTFAGWEPTVVAVTGDATYTAKFDQTKNSYTITWKNDDGSVIDTTTVEYGAMPTHADATKANTAEWTYTFTGWTPVVVAVTGDAEYTAKFDATKNKYTITFMNDNGDVLEAKEWEYGAMPSYDTSSLIKPADAQYSYTFKAWTPAVVAVTGDATYTATYEATLKKYTVNFLNEDGTVLQSSEVEYGTVPAYTGATPTKPADAQYTYTFKEWTPEIVAVTGPAEYTATYDSTVNKYTITFVNEDGTELQSSEVEYGTVPVYSGKTPTKAADAENTYVFAGWDPDLVAVIGEATYTAKFTETKNKYTIRFVNDDGTELQSSEVEYGTVPVYSGETPTKAADAQYTYTFKEWTPDIVAVTGDATYTATYDSTVNKYTIKFVDEDGTELQSSEVEYGTVPVYSGKTPTKAADAQYTYSFVGWTPTVAAVTGDATYTAKFEGTLNTYTVTWKNEDGTVLETDNNVPYGEIPTFNGTKPSKEQTNTTVYTFAGWNPEVTAVTGDAVYTAKYDETVRKYTVEYKNGDAVLKIYEVVYEADVPAYDGETPVKEGDAQYSYTFSGWDPAIEEDAKVTEDMTFTAQFTQSVNRYKVTWKVDGQEDLVETYEYNALPSYMNGATPTKEPTAEFTYTFDGWDPAVVAVTGDATYTAKFTETKRSYTVTWLNADGTTFATTTVKYGETPTAPEGTPTKAAAANETGTYTFTGWTPELAVVEGNQTYTASFTYTGWRTDETGKQYFIDSELQKTGLTEIDGAKYYLDPETGYAAQSTVVSTEEGDPGHAFDADGKWMEGCKEQVFKDEKNDEIYLVKDGIVEVYPGLYQDPETKFYYYFGGDEGQPGNTAIRGTDAWVEKNHADPDNPTDRGMLPKWGYVFGEDGVIEHDDVTLNGIVETAPGEYYYYIDGVKVHYGMFYQDGYYYYADRTGKLITSRTYWCSDNYTLWPEGPYSFDEFGRMILSESKNGIYEEDGSLFYYVDGVRNYAGLVYLTGSTKYHAKDGTVTPAEEGWYYVKGTGEVVHSRSYWITKTNGSETFPQGAYSFSDRGPMIIPEAPVLKNGVYAEKDSLYYYVDDQLTYAGLIYMDENTPFTAADGTVSSMEPGYYYVKGTGELIHGRSYWITKTNDIAGFKEGAYNFDEKGKLVLPDAPQVKNGIYEENDSLFYYVDGSLNYAGLIYLDGNTKYHAADGSVRDVKAGYYYVKGTGEMIHGRSYWITKTNDIPGFKQGAYTFDDEGCMVQ